MSNATRKGKSAERLAENLDPDENFPIFLSVTDSARDCLHTQYSASLPTEQQCSHSYLFSQQCLLSQWNQRSRFTLFSSSATMWSVGICEFISFRAKNMLEKNIHLVSPCSTNIFFSLIIRLILNFYKKITEKNRNQP